MLAVPFLVMFWHPPLPVLLGAAFLSAMGYCASLPLQDRLNRRAEPDSRGQMFGLAMNGMMVGQTIGALIAGTLASVVSVPTAMGVLAATSVLVTIALTPGLNRSRDVAALT